MKLQYFSGTHWDREWYQTYQGFRFRLVKMVDELLDGLERNTRYGVFHFDGQTVVLEDYLEIAPDNADRLKSLIQKGKIAIGPWYCMPDEFLVSGESLIKNLQKGHSIARSYGVEPMKYGYVCDVFGHIAQLPQIFKKMGIHHASLGRGTNEHETPAFFTWKAPDGSSVTSFKLNDEQGYGLFSPEKTPFFEEGVMPIPEERLKGALEYELARANIPFMILMDAIDHDVYHDETPEDLDKIKKWYPDMEVSHDNIMNFCKEIEEYLSEHKDILPVITGELNRPALRCGVTYVHLITNTLSSRYPLKKANDQLQTVLEKVVEPLYAYGLLKTRKTYVELANQYLLQNHPHDSICGCSIDQVHKDMEHRFDQVKEITDELITEFKTPYLCYDENKKHVIKIYNPLPYEVTKTVDVDIYFQPDYKTQYSEPFGYEFINSFKIFDSNGKEIPYGINDLKRNQVVFREVKKYDTVDVYSVSYQCTLAPSGITMFEVRPNQTPSRYLDKIRASANGGENDWIQFSINTDGTLKVLDKKTGRIFDNLLTVLDDAEIGDGWYHSGTACDKTIKNTVADIEKVVHTTAKLTFAVTQTINVPQKIVKDDSGYRRSAEYTQMKVVHMISLGRETPYLSIRTIIDNRALDHRMRLLLPTGVDGDRYFVNQPFCFVERKTDVDISTQDWRECEVLEKQTSGIVYKKNDNAGFAFISRYGLHECGVTGDGDMFITLFRSFGKTVRTNGEPGGQLQQELEFEYLLYPTGKDTNFAQLQRMQDIFATGQIVMNSYADEVAKPESGVKLEGDNLVFSTATPDRKIRIYNMSNETSTGRLNIYPLTEVDLDDQIIAEIPDGKLELGPWEIKTFAF